MYNRTSLAIEKGYESFGYYNAVMIKSFEYANSTIQFYTIMLIINEGGRIKTNDQFESIANTLVTSVDWI